MSDLSFNLTKALQERLAELGYYRLRIDGVDGPGTRNAIIRFKEAHGLRARAFVGPLTLSRLFSPDATPWSPPATSPAVLNSPPWLVESRGLLGLRETPGKASNPRIMQMARDLDQWYPGDDVPWCGLFVAHCMAVGAPDEPQDFNRLGARAWLEYGVAQDDRDVPLGGIGVLWRTHRVNSWHGHVFIITGQSNDAIRGIGGNQSDAVTETWFPRSRLLGVRGPNGFDLQSAPRAATGALSKSEA